MKELKNNACGFTSELPTSSIDEMIERVRLSYSARDFETAVGICSDLKSTGVEASQYGAYLYPALWELERLDECLIALDDYAQDSGDDCHAPVDRLKILYFLRHWEEAATAADYILDRWPWFLSEAELPEIYFLHGIALSMLGNELGTWRAIREGQKVARVTGMFRGELRQLAQLIQKSGGLAESDTHLLRYHPSINIPLGI